MLQYAGDVNAGANEETSTVQEVRGQPSKSYSSVKDVRAGIAQAV